ncbi:hypothetical protein OH77DRAFT_42788 [Trametes cingulata]|nr:hypothetical protein OH77DRAFT_42788 [Trametes cingulata]
MIYTIYAKERGSAPADDPHRPSMIVVHYDLPTIPPVPLQTGLTIRILALRPSPSPPSLDGSRGPPHYTITETGVVGTVETIRTMEETVTEFAVKNDNDQSPAAHAYISIQHIPGVTVRLNLWEALCRRVFLPPLPHTRHIPLELDAVILRNVTRLRPERERRVRHDSEDDERSEDMIVESESLSRGE